MKNEFVELSKFQEMYNFLKNYMDEHEEDVIVDDCPFNLNEEMKFQFVEYIKFNSKIVKYFINEGYSLSEIVFLDLTVSDDTKHSRRLLKEFAKFLVLKNFIINDKN